MYSEHLQDENCDATRRRKSIKAVHFIAPSEGIKRREGITKNKQRFECDSGLVEPAMIVPVRSCEGGFRVVVPSLYQGLFENLVMIG